MIKKIAHVCIAALNLAEVEKFYCAGLGFEKAFDFIRDGKVFGFYLKTADNSFIEVFRQDTLPVNENCVIRHICLETDDLDQLARHLKKLGYEVTDKRLGADRSWQIWVTDPSGVKIEFHQYTPESSQVTGKNCILS
ncbi:MAG: VOC family protein [Victivallaceae bacterium]